MRILGRRRRLGDRGLLFMGNFRIFGIGVFMV